MTSFRVLGPGNFECLEPNCEYPVTPNAAGHAIRFHNSYAVLFGTPESADQQITSLDLADSSETEEATNAADTIVSVLPDDEKPKVVYFGRRNFYGDHSEQAPKMHINKRPWTGKYGDFEGYCGYSRRNILGDLIISRSKRPPHREVLCKVCVTNLKDLS